MWLHSLPFANEKTYSTSEPREYNKTVLKSPKGEAPALERSAWIATRVTTRARDSTK